MLFGCLLQCGNPLRCSLRVYVAHAVLRTRDDETRLISVALANAGATDERERIIKYESA